jgi:hypothetical protein
MISTSPMRFTGFRLPIDLIAALHQIRDRDGVPIAEQARRALSTWVESRGIKGEGRTRGAARKRPINLGVVEPPARRHR